MKKLGHTINKLNVSVEYDNESGVEITEDMNLLSKDHEVWLPRQDQLQEMIEWEEKGSYTLSLMCFHINEFYNTCGEWAQEDSASMEQLWLAFVMKARYSKTWNGADWLKEEG